MADAQWTSRQPNNKARLCSRSPFLPEMQQDVQMATDHVASHEVRVWSEPAVRVSRLRGGVPLQERAPETHEHAQ